jgi:hypothetical protein
VAGLPYKVIRKETRAGPELAENAHEKGSPGRTRTYNPPVNSPINKLLPHYAGLCFNVLLCVFAQETHRLTFCFYLP